MSHFIVNVVIRDATDRTDAEAKLDDLLAPFDENMPIDPYPVPVDDSIVERAIEVYRESDKDPLPDPLDDETKRRIVGWYECNDEDLAVLNEDGSFSVMSRYNPDSKWDWWVLGGRWEGYYQIKPDSDDTREFADLARKGDIDFDRMRAEAILRAHNTYDAFEKATEGLEVPSTWMETLKLAFFEANLDPDANPADLSEQEREHSQKAVSRAREQFNMHPWNRALRQAELIFMSDPHETFFVGARGGRAAYVQHAAEEVGIGYAFLVDGQWHQQGQMGWFGMGSNEKDAATWHHEAARIIDSLPDDAYLAAIDCHI